MAKRAPADEAVYSPLDMTLAQSVVKGAVTVQDGKKSLGEKVGERSDENLSHGHQSDANGHIVELPSPRTQTPSPKTRGTRRLNREKRVLITPEE